MPAGYLDVPGRACARRGEDDGSSFTFSADHRSQQWSLDALGNWAGFATGFDDQYGDVESRDHNDVNEVTEQSAPGVQDPLALVHDAAGNMTKREIPAGQNPSEIMYVWDAWNRLVRVEVNENVRAEYDYNGLNWRITKRADTSEPPDGTLNQERRMYYNANWQLLEEEIDDDVDTSFNVDRRMQYFWGPPEERYIDDIVMRRQDTGNDGIWNDSWYHLADTLFSTVAIIDEHAKLVERVSYDAYGNARHHRAADLTGNGAVDTEDLSALNGNWGEYGVGDLNRDGVVNTDDLFILNADWGGALPAGQLSSSGGTDNIVGYAGYIFNAEVPGYSSSVAGGLSAGLYTVRHRHYAPDLGRWLSRDPLGYVDGMSLYEYVRSHPTLLMDPNGLVGTLPSQPRPIQPFGDWVPGPGYQACLGSCRRKYPNPGPGGFNSKQICYDKCWVEHREWTGAAEPQDGICTVGGPLGRLMNSNPCILRCCRDHDRCYEKHGCSARSWRDGVGPDAYRCEPPECHQCNKDVVKCMSKCLPPKRKPSKSEPRSPRTVPTRGTPREKPRPSRKPSDGRPWPGSPAH